MKILVVNTGSSSLKFQLIDHNKKYEVYYKGIVDGIGRKACFFEAKFGKKTVKYKKLIKNHEQALKEALKVLIDKKILKDLTQIKAVGHRVVHGGDEYKDATLITPNVKKIIKKLSELAPLHNPPNLQGIMACEKQLPHAKNVAVFDTAFHQTIPEKAFRYAIPEEWYKKYGIRRYGFHGTSHKYVSGETYKLLRKKKGKIITCHLGNGSSISAVVDGKCIDTSMGFTPLEGVPMGTRSGSIDPAIPLYIMDKKKISANKIDDILNHEAGIKGVSTFSPDLREIWAKAQKKNKKALFTLELLAYRIALQIGAYAAAMNGVNAITFTAGIGQNAWYLRRDIIKYLSFWDAKLDNTKNRKNARSIHKKSSKLKIFVLKTNEGLQIAHEVSHILRSKKN
jgi:acetate kinase